MAILFYVCAKYNPELLGNKPNEKAKVSMLTWKMRSMSEEVFPLVFDKGGFQSRVK